MSVFFRTLQHLLPDGAAWRTTVLKKLRSLLEGLATLPEAVRVYLDAVYNDIWPSSTRELALWESQFALVSTGDDAERRQRLDAAWKALGGQSPKYIQDVLHANGFTSVFVHEWWESGPDPWVPRDPRLYTLTSTIGTVQCGEPLAQCGESSALANAFLANDPRYLVNLDLTPRPPPPVPDDPTKWPFFLYLGGEIFGDAASVPLDRKAEFQRLLLRICPAEQWLVLLVDYVAGPANRVTLGGDVRVTLGGDTRVTKSLL